MDDIAVPLGHANRAADTLRRSLQAFLKTQR